MSEYQYYEFQAIDRLLSPDDIRVLRSHSTRARITPSSFVNEYSFGGFKGDENEWMAKYFDAFLYVANWGTRILMLRLPSSVLPKTDLTPYCSGEKAWQDSLTTRTVNGYVVLSFSSEDENGGEWIDGVGLLAPLLPIRADLAKGDHRALYLAWLHGIQDGRQKLETREPRVPPGLKTLSPSLVAFASFLRIDSDLITAAAVASADLVYAEATPGAAAQWIAELPSAEKDALLLRLLQGQAGPAGMEMRNQFERRRASKPTKLPTSRTVGQLLEAAESVRQTREHEEARRAAEELARSEREERAARARRLDELSLRIPQTWNEIETLVSKNQRAAYAEAARLLLDMRELATRNQTHADFVERFGALCDRYSRKKAFLDLLTKLGLRS